MKKKIVFALSLVAGVTLISLAADPAGGKARESDTLSELRAQVAELRAEVNKLHQRTQTLESSVEELKHSHAPSPLNLQSSPAMPSPSTLTPSHNASHPPAVWGQGEVNGWTYYIVPCEQQSR